MFKKMFVVLMLLVCVNCVVYAQAPIYYQDSVAGKILPVSDLKPLPVDAAVTIGSMTIDTNITPVTDWATQTLTLVANTAQGITTALTSTNRRFIELKAHDQTDVFWVDFGAVAVVGASRPCSGYFYGEIPIGITVSVIASTAYDVAATEGGDN